MTVTINRPSGPASVTFHWPDALPGRPSERESTAEVGVGMRGSIPHRASSPDQEATLHCPEEFEVSQSANEASWECQPTSESPPASHQSTSRQEGGREDGFIQAHPSSPCAEQQPACPIDLEFSRTDEAVSAAEPAPPHNPAFDREASVDHGDEGCREDGLIAPLRGVAAFAPVRGGNEMDKSASLAKVLPSTRPDRYVSSGSGRSIEVDPAPINLAALDPHDKVSTCAVSGSLLAFATLVRTTWFWELHQPGTRLMHLAGRTQQDLAKFRREIGDFVWEEGISEVAWCRTMTGSWIRGLEDEIRIECMATAVDDFKIKPISNDEVAEWSIVNSPPFPKNMITGKLVLAQYRAIEAAQFLIEKRKTAHSDR